MKEIIYHFLGICGEHSHPNITHVLLFAGIMIPLYIYSKKYLNSKK
jgi:hypothetical protein